MQRHIAVLIRNGGLDQSVVEFGVVLPNAFVELRDWLEKDVLGFRESLHQFRRAGKNADVDNGGYGDLSFDKNFQCLPFERTASTIGSPPDLKTQHILFEPVSEFHKRIRKNYAKLDYRLIEAAVTDQDRDVTLHVRKVISQTEVSHSSVVDEAPDNSETRIVPSTRLDTFTKANALAKPYLVKIDVDGNEMKILSGATETLKDASVVIIEAPKSEFSARIAFLEKQGFVLFDLAAPCYYDDSFWQCDAIFVRSEVQRRYFKQMEQRFEPSRLRRV